MQCWYGQLYHIERLLLFRLLEISYKSVLLLALVDWIGCRELSGKDGGTGSRMAERKEGRK